LTLIGELMDAYRKILTSAMVSDERLRNALKEVLDSLGMTVQDLAKRSGVSPSTLYKIMNEDRSPSLGVMRKIVRAIAEVEGLKAGNFIALIAARHVLNEIEERPVQIGSRAVRIREYPASTIEDAIVTAIRAERDGAVAIVCAPIVSATIERVVDIPIATIMPRDSVTEAIKLAARKSNI
jgi:predicted transcriptional regulator